MNKQVKVNINDKDYYCDSEILKLIMRNQDKIELLEYRIDKVIEYIKGKKAIFLKITLEFINLHLQSILVLLQYIMSVIWI